MRFLGGSRKGLSATRLQALQASGYWGIGFRPLRVGFRV